MMSSFFDEQGLIYQILVTLGFNVNIEITNTYEFIYCVFISLVAVIFLVMFLKILFVTVLNFFKSVSL